jgi:tetrapyrrole methylase family protein/MazG family protein
MPDTPQPTPTPDERELRPVEEAYGRLYAIVRRLRAPDGCPWDREQSSDSLRGSLIEEAYECVSAIEEGNTDNLREELGDLMLVSTMIAYMNQQEGRFTLSEVFGEICEKLIRRHPHVFGEVEVKTAGEVLAQWEHIKENVERKEPKTSALQKVPRTLPPLERAFLIQQKVSKVGFDWKEVGPLWEKLEEEIAELKEARRQEDPREIEREFGDLLFTMVNLGRLLGVDPTLALNSTNEKFIARFREMERRLQERGLEPGMADLPAMDAVWEEIKAERGKE